jgi:death-on-curing protein
MAILYITMEQAIATHGLTIEKSGGGADGALELDKLDAVLEHIQNDLY